MTLDLSPSAILIGALLAGFVLWLAKQNRLSVYWGLIFGSSTSSTSSSPSYLIPPFNNPFTGSPMLPGITN